MTRGRVISIGSIVALLPGCAVGGRVGPRVGVADGDFTYQAEGTLALGWNNDKQRSVTVPLTLAMGDIEGQKGGRGATQLESGLELGYPFEDSLFGFRAGGRGGAWLDGRTGGYVGLRAGPTVALVERKGVEYGDAQVVPTIALEGFANVGAGGSVAGTPNVGGVLTIGADLFTSIDLRMRSGRPLSTSLGAPVTAKTRRGRGWASTKPTRVAAVPPGERSVVGTAWLDDAVMEHASIAAFSKLALDLLALGAPSVLVERAHRAALDEARHARTCFSLAAAYLDRVDEPGPLPLHTAVTLAPSFASLALVSIVDGAYGEGVAATVARSRARSAQDPAVRRALRSIASDEARHAELAWDVIAWCLECDATTRTTLQSGFEWLAARLRACPGGAAEPERNLAAARASGLATAPVVRRARARVMARVGQQLTALLASSPKGRPPLEARMAVR